MQNATHGTALQGSGRITTSRCHTQTLFLVRLLLDLRKDLGVLKEVVLLNGQLSVAIRSKSKSTTYFLSNFYRVSSPSGQQHAISRLHACRDDLAILVGRARADSDDGRFGKRT